MSIGASKHQSIKNIRGNADLRMLVCACEQTLILKIDETLGSKRIASGQ
jgi:hypothetical protein